MARGVGVCTATVDIEDLAVHVVRALVFGPVSHRVCRDLASINRFPGGELLEPGDLHADPLSPLTWSSTEGADKYFHKLVCVGQCSKVAYIMMELTGGIEDLRYRGQIVRELRVGHGFMTHEYSLLALAGDFSNVPWQYGQSAVDNACRVHSWLVFDVDGQDESIVLDLTGPQYDIFSPREDIYLVSVPSSDGRYRECYATPRAAVPLEFIRWSACYDLQETQAAHLVTVVQHLQQTLNIPRATSSSVLEIHDAMLFLTRSMRTAWPNFEEGERVGFVAGMPEVQEIVARTGMTFAMFGLLEFSQEEVETKELRQGRLGARSCVEAALAVPFGTGGESMVLEPDSWVVIQMPGSIHHGQKAEVVSINWSWGLYRVRLSKGTCVQMRAENLRMSTRPSLLECRRLGITEGPYYQRLMRESSHGR